MQDKEEKRKTYIVLFFTLCNSDVTLRNGQSPDEYEPLKLHTGYNKRNFTLLRISLRLCLKRYHHFVKMWKHLSLTEFQIYRNIFPQRMTTLALTPLIPPPRFSPNLTEITPCEWNWPVHTEAMRALHLQVSDVSMHFGEAFLQDVGQAGLEVASLSLELRRVELAASFVDDCRPWVNKRTAWLWWKTTHMRSS